MLSLKPLPIVLLGILTLAGAYLPAQEALGNPLGGLERLKDFETMRSSSSDPNWQNGGKTWLLTPSARSGRMRRQ
jgi:hypothetical protein